MTAEAALPLPKYTYTINVHAAYIHAIVHEAYGATLMLMHPDGDLIEQPVSQQYLQRFKPELAGYYTWDPDMEEEGHMIGSEFEKRFNREDTVSDLPIATESD